MRSTCAVSWRNSSLSSAMAASVASTYGATTAAASRASSGRPDHEALGLGPQAQRGGRGVEPVEHHAVEGRPLQRGVLVDGPDAGAGPPVCEAGTGLAGHGATMPAPSTRDDSPAVAGPGRR